MGFPAGSAPAAAELSGEVRTIVLMKLLRADSDSSDFNALERECVDAALKQLTTDLGNRELAITASTMPGLLDYVDSTVLGPAGGFPEVYQLAQDLIPAIASDPETLESAEPRFVSILDKICPAEGALLQGHERYADVLAPAIGKSSVNLAEHVSLLVRMWTRPAGVEGLVAIARQEPDLAAMIMSSAWDLRAASEFIGPAKTFEDLWQQVDPDGKFLRPILLKHLTAQMTATSKLEYWDAINAGPGKVLLAILGQLSLDRAGAEEAAKQLLEAIQDDKSHTLAARSYYVSSLSYLGPAVKDSVLPAIQRLSASIKPDGTDADLRPLILKAIEYFSGVSQ